MVEGRGREGDREGGRLGEYEASYREGRQVREGGRE